MKLLLRGRPLKAVRILEAEDSHARAHLVRPPGGFGLRGALIALVLFAGCQAPELRDIPLRAPIRVNGSKLSTVALVTYAQSVNPSAVSDGSFCPHADRRLFQSYFSAPEAILAEELRALGYPVTDLPAPLGTEFAGAYPTRVAVSFVGESRCETRVPLFGSRQVEDCSVRVRLSLRGDGGGGIVSRAFERTGDSSILTRVHASEEPGPTPAWREAVRDAVRQILEDPAAAAILTGVAVRP